MVLRSSPPSLFPCLSKKPHFSSFAGVYPSSLELCDRCNSTAESFQVFDSCIHKDEMSLLPPPPARRRSTVGLAHWPIYFPGFQLPAVSCGLEVPGRPSDVTSEGESQPDGTSECPRRFLSSSGPCVISCPHKRPHSRHLYHSILFQSFCFIVSYC